MSQARSSAFRAAAAFGKVLPDGFPKNPEGQAPDRLCLSRSNDPDYEVQLAALLQAEAEEEAGAEAATAK